MPEQHYLRSLESVLNSHDNSNDLLLYVAIIEHNIMMCSFFSFDLETQEAVQCNRAEIDT